MKLIWEEEIKSLLCKIFNLINTCQLIRSGLPPSSNLAEGALMNHFAEDITKNFTEIVKFLQSMEIGETEFPRWIVNISGLNGVFLFENNEVIIFATTEKIYKILKNKEEIKIDFENLLFADDIMKYGTSIIAFLEKKLAL